jgi:hypothetical protein
MNSWASSSCKWVFIGEFDIKLVYFGIRAGHHIKYGIVGSSLSMRSNELQRCNRVTEEAAHGLN